MAISERDTNELERLYGMHKSRLGGRKNDYFAFLYLTRELERSAEELEQYVAVGGNNEYGIDAYYIDKKIGNLYLYQFKWSEDHNLFKESLERFTKDGIERIFGNNQTQDPSQHTIISNLKRDIKEQGKRISQVHIRYIFKGNPECADNSQGLQNLLENFEDKKYIIQNYFKKFGERDIWNAPLNL